MAKKKKPEDEIIIEGAPQVGGPVYPIPEFDDVGVKIVRSVGEIPQDVPPVHSSVPDDPLFDGWVGEVGTVYYSGPTTGSPYNQDQAITVWRSDIEYGTNNDPVIEQTIPTNLTVPGELALGTGRAKPFPPRHDQAAYHVAAGDSVLVLTGKDGKNWYLADELPFVAVVLSVDATNSLTVEPYALGGDPDGGAFDGATFSSLLDKDGNTTTYSDVRVLAPSAQHRDYAVGDTVLVTRRGRYLFTGTGHELPVGTKNSRLLHSGSVWFVIREGIVKLTTNNADGTYVGTEQQWDDDAGGWIDATATGFLDGATLQDILDRVRPAAAEATTGIRYHRFWQTVDEDDNVDNIVDIAAMDGRVLCSADDNTPGHLEDKIVGDGTWTSVSTLNDGSDEDVEVAHEDWSTDRTTVGSWYGVNTATESQIVMGTHVSVGTDQANTTIGESHMTLEGFLDEYDAKMHSRAATDTGATYYVKFTAEPTTADEKVGVDSGATAGYIGASETDGVLRVNTTWISYVNSGDYITLAHKASPEGQDDRIQYTAGATEFIVYKSGNSSTNTWTKVEWGAVGHVAAMFQQGNATSYAWPSEVL